MKLLSPDKLARKSESENQKSNPNWQHNLPLVQQQHRLSMLTEKTFAATFLLIKRTQKKKMAESKTTEMAYKYEFEEREEESESETGDNMKFLI